MGPALWLCLLSQAPVGPAPPAQVAFEYRIRLRPSERLAQVALTVRQEGPGLARLRLHIDPGRHIGFKGDGEVRVDGPDYIVWETPATGGGLSWTSRLDHLRNDRSYDARVATDWALFRGSDLVPPGSSRFTGTSRGRFKVTMPKKWQMVSPHRQTDRGWYSLEGDRFFKRPRGWMMAGRLSTERFEVEGLEIELATPRRLGLDLMDIRSFLRWTIPTYRELLTELPERLVIVGAGDPMWRGGLSGPSSIYLHRDRPLVDSDGTSPLLHELVHVFMQAKAGEDGDWIVEGLAELYAIEVLHRSGGMSDEERRAAQRRLRRRGRRVTQLTVSRVTGRTTARAVAVLFRLDQRMKDLTNDRVGMDQVLQRLATEDGIVTTERFQRLVEELTEHDLDPFFETFVREAQAP